MNPPSRTCTVQQTVAQNEEKLRQLSCDQEITRRIERLKSIFASQTNFCACHVSRQYGGADKEKSDIGVSFARVKVLGKRKGTNRRVVAGFDISEMRVVLLSVLLSCHSVLG